MQYSGIRSLALLGLVLLPAGELAFEPEEGLVLTKSLESTMEIELLELTMSMEVDGEERDSQSPELEVAVVTTRAVVFVDEVLEVADGRATSLRRTFETIIGDESLEVESPEDSQSNERDGASELEGSAVVFTWDDDDEDWTVEFDEDSEGDDELLEGLVCAADWTELTPADGDAEEGDSWEVDASAYTAIRQLGGELALLLEGEEEIPPSRPLFHENLSGELTCTWTETRSEDGDELALITIEGDLESEYSFSPDVEEAEVEMVWEVTLELSGELLWDLDARRARSLELGGDVSMTETLTQARSADEHELLMTRVQEFAGTIAMSGTIE